MANILLVTNIYTLKNIKLYGSTDVCRYFVNEWVKKGHNVRVVYNYSIFQKLFHSIAKKFSKIICNYFPGVVNSERFESAFEYELDGVRVLLNPIYRTAPKSQFNTKNLEQNSNSIIQWLNQDGFVPEVIVGHFLHPNLQILPILKKYYQCEVAIVTHGKYNKKRDYKSLKIFSKSIDLWGFRSSPIKKSFDEIINIPDNRNFLCYSGIPSGFISKDSWQKHKSDKIPSIIYVGNLIKRKYPLAVVRTFSNFKANQFESLKIIGTGKQYENIRKYILKNNLDNRIEYLGRLPRNEVRNQLMKSEIFVMISKDETFGLVYLEAMACGCIVIASRDEGMDGIIEDGVNGFLCKAGDESELELILEKIYQLDINNRIMIAKNAILTAMKMTDENMANKYLNSIIPQKNSNFGAINNLDE